MKFQMGKTYYTCGGRRTFIIAVDDTPGVDLVQGDDKIWRHNRQNPSDLGKTVDLDKSAALLPFACSEESYACIVHQREMAAQICRLQDVLRTWKCPACNNGKFEQHGAGKKAKHNVRNNKLASLRGEHPEHRFVKCKVCNGVGLHPNAIRALLGD